MNDRVRLATNANAKDLTMFCEHDTPAVASNARQWIILPVLFSVSLVLGCAEEDVAMVFGRAPAEPTVEGLFGRRTIIRDFLPDNAPRGYVEFYLHEESTLPAIPLVYYDLAGIRRAWTEWGKGRDVRIAMPPGSHVFGVILGTDKREVSVNAVEGMITPVEISGRNLGETPGGYTIAYHFSMGVTVQDPVTVGDTARSELPQTLLVLYHPTLRGATGGDWGELTIGTTEIRFQGQKKQLAIGYEDIESVSLGRFTNTVSNILAADDLSELSGSKCVVVQFGNASQSQYASFSTGHKLPQRWDRLVWAVKSALQQKGMSDRFQDPK